MNIRESGDQCHDRKINPLRGLPVEAVQRDEERKGPQLKDDGSENPAVDDFAKVSGRDHRYHADYCRRNGKEIRLGRVEPEVSQGKGEICLWGSDRH